jgi:photosystem II stability/assembly factor-like uncharacterized protein
MHDIATTGNLLLATNHGVTICDRGDAGWRVQARSLAESSVTSIIAREGVILAGTTDGIVRSDDGGRTWRPADGGLTLRHVRWMAYDPAMSDHEFSGTEPAGIFVSRDGGERWTGKPEVEELRDRHGWWLPYSPEAGCVRGFAFHGARVYAAVEVGGVLRSDDGGESWRLAGGSTGEPIFDIPPEPNVFADVHSVVEHPCSPDLVFAVTAEGLYRSNDGGETWAVSHAGSYCRAAWVDPGDPDHVILGPADTVQVNKKNGRIEETRDGGCTWQRVSDGLDLPWPDRMVERFTAIGDELFAVTSDGRLYVAPLDTLQWQRLVPEIDGINAVWPGAV